MFSVTVRTDWRFGISSFDQLAVDTVPVLLRHLFMTFSAGNGDVEMLDRRLKITLGKDFMSCSLHRMTVIAGRCCQNAAFDSLSMNAAFVNIEGMPCPYVVFFD